MTIRDICASFDVNGKYVRCEEIGTGNINCTYKVEYVRDGEKKEYIIQRINKNVFKEPEKVMENIVRVTENIRAQVKENGLDTHVFVLRAPISMSPTAPSWLPTSSVPSSTTTRPRMALPMPSR